MKITEDYVTFETAKLLKENGFDVMCGSEYYTSVRHNGREISYDEELDLKGEGRGDEIDNTENKTWDYYKVKYQPLFNSLRSELVKLCDRPKEI